MLTLLIATPLMMFGILWDTIISVEVLINIVFIPRILLIFSIIFLVIGFTPSKEEIVKNESIKNGYLDGTKISSIKSIFATRPVKITEEEVTFYRERKICLVCKGKATKFTFICDTCTALYCNKCATALIHLENACWACDGVLDESKPVKLPEKREEQEAVIEEEASKKKK